MTVRLLVLAVAVLLSACTTQPSRFYHLTAQPMTETASAATTPRRVVAVEAVDIPDYLDRSEMVMRGEGSRLVVMEFDRWGGAVDRMVTRVLAQNLSAELGTVEVVEMPVGGDVPLDQIVEVKLNRLDASVDGPAVLEARWRLVGQTGARRVRFGRTAVQEPVAAPGGPGQVAEALSRALTRLAQDIAGALGQRTRVSDAASP